VLLCQLSVKLLTQAFERFEIFSLKIVLNEKQMKAIEGRVMRLLLIVTVIVLQVFSPIIRQQLFNERKIKAPKQVCVGNLGIEFGQKPLQANRFG
jgi:hypothetical protein